MSRSKSLLTAVLVLIAFATFIALGFWQLDRAAQVKELRKPYQEKPIVPLSKVSQPNTNLPGESVNRIVEFSGSYVAAFSAPNQVDRDGERATWLVGLMEVDGGGYIMVVRSNLNSDLPRGDIFVTGRLFHRQYEDVVDRSDGALSRLDPSLLVSDYPGDYFDGFVLAQSEIRDGIALDLPRVALNPAAPTIPGYYWQHIAYVVIWWLMALVVVFLPLYSRFREREGATRE
jgi:cytochrome oxidase assembly protein ShyY1